MSQEISLSLKFAAIKGDFALSDSPGTLKFDMSGTHGFSQVFDVGASPTEIEIPLNILIYGWCLITNLDDTDYVDLSTSSGSFNSFEFSRLPPSGTNLLYLNSSKAYYARTASEYGANLQIKVTVLEQ